jgi:hypothetical protein
MLGTCVEPRGTPTQNSVNFFADRIPPPRASANSVRNDRDRALLLSAANSLNSD